MKTTSFKSLLITLAFLTAGLHMACAQSYSIDWFTVDGGGGTSTNAQFTLSGTIGQPDASGSMTDGDNLSLTGGFWALYAVQTPGAPALSIKLTNNMAMVYWPYPAMGFNLQVNTNLATTNWIAPSQTVSNNGAINYILVNPQTGNRYYRLKNP